VFAPAGVLAQTWSPPVPPGCPQAPADQAASRAMASEFFQRGLTAVAEGRFAQATALYACCFHIIPHPNTMYNLGLAAEKAGDLRTAEHALDRYVTEAPEALNHDEAVTLLATVRERVAALPPEENPTTLVAVGPEPAECAAGQAAQPDGTCAAEPPPPPECAAGTMRQADGTCAAPYTPPEGLSTLAIAGWSLLGTGAAITIAGGAAFGVLAGQEADAIEDPPDGAHWRDSASHLDTFDDYQAAEIAMLVIGGAVLATGAVLLILDSNSESPEAETAVVPVVTEESVGLGLVGRF
jgi:hypothetical protein